MHIGNLILLVPAVLAALVPVASTAGSSITIPAPKPSSLDDLRVVAHERSYLVETGRKDPYNPSEDRKLAFSLFVPVLDKHCTKYCDNAYMPNKTAKASNLQFFGAEDVGVFEQMSFKSCCESSVAVETLGMKVLVLEPGAGTSRLLYTQLARQLSALDMAVVTIDHTYDAPIVEFEDGVGKPAKESPVIATGKEEDRISPFTVEIQWNATMVKALNTRRADIHFVLNQLGEPDMLRKLFPNVKFTKPLNTTSVYMVGHGFGGTTATTISISDERMSWSLNLGGTVLPVDTDTYHYTVYVDQVTVGDCYQGQGYR